LCFAFLAIQKGSTVIASKARQPSCEAIQRGEKLAALPLVIRSDSESFEQCEIAKMQEDAVDSRLRGNDSSQQKGLKAFCK